MLKVLLAIEEEGLLLALRKQFEVLGFEIDVAREMSLIVDKLKNHRPHVVVSQARGQHIRGLEVARLINKKATLPKIILLKGDDETLDSALLMKHQVDKVICLSEADKMIDELSAFQVLVQGVNKTPSHTMSSTKRVPEAKLKEEPGRREKYANLIHEYDTRGGFVVAKLNSARVVKATRAIKNELKLDSDHEDLRREFAEALCAFERDGD